MPKKTEEKKTVKKPTTKAKAPTKKTVKKKTTAKKTATVKAKKTKISAKKTSKVTSDRITKLRSEINKELYKEIEFSFFAPLSQEVCVAGSFSDWNKKRISLKPSNEGVWSAKIKLKPGQYEYRYIIDGTWENDQKPVEMRVNEFGEANCVLTVE